MCFGDAITVAAVEIGVPALATARDLLECFHRMLLCATGRKCTIGQARTITDNMDHSRLIETGLKPLGGRIYAIACDELYNQLIAGSPPGSDVRVYAEIHIWCQVSSAALAERGYLTANDKPFSASRIGNYSGRSAGSAPMPCQKTSCWWSASHAHMRLLELPLRCSVCEERQFGVIVSYRAG
jgi:hypothetical protein